MVVQVAIIPDDKVGNGLGVNYKTGLVYTSTEGNFLPGGGEVYEIDPTIGRVSIINNQLWAADGLWIDQAQQVLYVGQLFKHNVVPNGFALCSMDPIDVMNDSVDILLGQWAYNMPLHQDLGIFPGLNNNTLMPLLDDFCLVSLSYLFRFSLLQIFFVHVRVVSGAL